MKELSKDGLNLIISFEGLRLTAYKAISTEKYYTIGYGHYGSDVTKGMRITKGEAERIRFTKSAEYKKLIKDHPEQEAVARELTEAGIRDTNKMGIALEGIKEGRYSAGEAAAYMRMAEAKDCPDEVLYSKSKFEEYLKARGIPTANAEKIRKGIVEFK